MLPGPVPWALVAATVTVYEVPWTSPVRVQAVPVAGLGVQVTPPGTVVTVYDVIAELPWDVGALQETARLPDPGVTATPVGGPGRPSLPVASSCDSHWKVVDADVPWEPAGDE